MLSAKASLPQACTLAFRLSHIRDMLGPECTELTDALVGEAAASFRLAVSLPAQSHGERIAKIDLIERALQKRERDYMPGMLASIALSMLRQAVEAAELGERASLAVDEYEID